MWYVVLNSAKSTLATALLIGETSAAVQSGDGALFAVSTNYSYLVLEDDAGHREVVKLTARASDALTIERAQDGTTERNWNIGDIIECRPCRAAFNALRTETATHAATEKTSIADNDEFPLADSAASYDLKRIKWSTIRQAVVDAFTVVYADAEGAVGDGSTDDWAVLQGILDTLPAGYTMRLTGGKTYLVSKPMAFMANAAWKTTAYNAGTARFAMHIDGQGAEIKWATSVDWEDVQPEQPYPERQISQIATDTREPRMITVGNVDFGSIRNLRLNGNMQARAGVHGNPGTRENEHAIYLIGCKGFVIDNVTTQDTMGDGITVGYAYVQTTGQSSSFRNGGYATPSVPVSGNMCEEPVITNTRHFRHSRLGVAVVGCVGGRFDNLYSEEIDSVTNFQSAAGPGATIDFECNTDGSVVRDCVASNIIAVDHAVTGPLAAMRCRNVTVTNLICSQRTQSVTYPVHFSGDARGVVVNGIAVGSPTDADMVNNTLIYCGSGTSAATSPKGISVSNITTNEGAKFSYLARIGDNADVAISNVSGYLFEPADVSQALVIMSGTNSGKLQLRDIEVNVPTGAAGCDAVFSLAANQTLLVNDFRIYAPDSVAIAQDATDGLVDFTGTGNTVELNDVVFACKSNTLINEASSSDANTVRGKNIRHRGVATWPSLTPISTLDLDGVHVESCYNNGSSTRDAMLLLYLKSSQTWNLRNLRSHSEGAYSFNKCSVAGIIKTDAADFDSLTNCSCVIEGLSHFGGRSSDGAYSLQAYANGVNVAHPWDRTKSVAKNLVRASKININHSANGLPFSTTTASASQSFLWGGTTGNMAFWPNGPVNVKPNSTLPAALPYWREHDAAGSASGNHMSLYFPSAPASAADWLMRTA